MELSNKITLVTGGASGLGAAVVKRLQEEGATVLFTDLNSEHGNQYASACGARFYEHNVADLGQWQGIVNDIVRDYTRIDVLVHCAGIGGDVSHGGLETTQAMWNHVMAVNLSGSFWACKTVMPEMLKQGKGSIVLMSSVAAYLGTPNLLAYGVSKAGVTHLSKSMALLGAEQGAKVRCNTIHPGIINTPMLTSTMSEFAKSGHCSTDEIEKAMCEAVPFGHVGHPDDVANMVVFLASDKSSYITGGEFKVDGGWSIHDERP